MSGTRVLHVIGGLQLGGTETLLYSLVERRSEFEHEVISLAGRDWYSDKLEALGVKVHHLGIASAGDAIGGIFRLYWLVRHSEADVVQTWMYRSNLLGGLSAKACGVPVVWGNHSARLDAAGWSSQLSAKLGGWLAPWLADFVINCSNRTSTFHAEMGYGRAPNAVIFNGVDSNRFTMEDAHRELTRKELGLDADQFVVGTLARYTPQKDIPALLKAIRLAADDGVPLVALLVGRGLESENPQLLEDIHTAGCEALVRPLGPRSEVADVARSFDLHLFGSLFESFGNVVAETMLCGVPNASTDVGETPLMIGDTGWIVDPGDAEALAQAIGNAYHEWKHDPAEWQGRRARCRDRILERFTLKRMAKQYEAVWDRVAKHS